MALTSALLVLNEGSVLPRAGKTKSELIPAAFTWARVLESFPLARASLWSLFQMYQETQERTKQKNKREINLH